MADPVAMLLEDRFRKVGDEGAEWMPVSDLMAVLMVVFLFIAISLMSNVITIADSYQDTRQDIYRALMEEFGADLVDWEAEIDSETLSVEFLSPDVLFDTGKIGLKPRFREIVRDFFPRYLRVLKRFDGFVKEVRIEGHTSSIWNAGVSETVSYFNNMYLSQERTRSVLKFVYRISELESYRPWIRKHVAAVGYSFAHRRYTADGTEDVQRSQRVVFRVLTSAEEQLERIRRRGRGHGD